MYFNGDTDASVAADTRCVYMLARQNIIIRFSSDGDTTVMTTENKPTLNLVLNSLSNTTSLVRGHFICNTICTKI